MRLITANLCSGRRLDGTVATAEELAAAVSMLRPDVLALQELDVGLPRSGGTDQAAAATAGLLTTGTRCRFVTTVPGTPGDRHARSAESAADGGYGIALATSRPVREWHELRLAPAPGRYPLPIPARPPRVLLLPDEPRAAVAAVLEQPRITVACTHLSFVPGVNALQLRRVLAWLATLPGPRLLLGDLNLPPGVVRLLARDWSPLAAAPTFPSFGPKVQLDHVLAHGLPAVPAAAETVRLPFSDHLALAVELAL